MREKRPENRFILPEDVKEARMRQLRERFAAANPVRPKSDLPRRPWSGLRAWQWAVLILLVLALLLGLRG